MEPPPRSYLLPGSVAVVADSGALSGPGACSDEKRKRIVESGEKSGFGQQSKRHSIIKGALVGASRRGGPSGSNVREAGKKYPRLRYSSHIVNENGHSCP